MDVLKNYLQAIGLVIVFLVTLLKERFIEARPARPARTLKVMRRLYWSSMVLGLLLGLLGVYVEYRTTRNEQATKGASLGRAVFHAGIETNSRQEIQNGVRILQEARTQLDRSPIELPNITVGHDLALATERLAYAKSGGCIYRLIQPTSTDEKSVTTCRTEEGSAIYVTPKALKTEIRCTDIASETTWSDAKKLYDDLLAVIAPLDVKSQSASIKSELAKAARSVAYFYLCDQLRRGVEHRADISRALDIANTATLEVEDRHSDIINKQAFAHAAASLQLGKFACVDPCSSDNKGSQRRYVQFRGSALAASFTPTNVTIQSDYAELARDEASGAIESKAICTVTSFTEAVSSWSAETPGNSFISVSASARIGGVWTKFYVLGQWSSAGTLRNSPASQSDAYGSVDGDTLVLRQPADALKFQVNLTAGPKGDVPRLISLSAAVWGESDQVPNIPEFGAARGVELPVPPLSQKSYKKVGGNAWCSPTSLAMVLDYWSTQSGKKASAASAHASLEEIARGVSDSRPNSDYRYGNWSFNVAYANGLDRHEFDAFVTRLFGIAQLERLILAGIPVVVSMKWHDDALKGAPLPNTEGHLMVVRGFDRSGNVIANDPAAEANFVRRIYDRAQFDSAWSKKNRTVYIVHPYGRPLPVDGAAGAW